LFDLSHNYSIYNVTDLTPGSHLCCIYETEEEHHSLLTQYLSQGLLKNEKVIYIVANHTAKTILGYLEEEKIKVEHYLSTGQLSILEVCDAYMRDGAFDPDSMIALLKSETKKAVEEGYSGLRVTGEMTWTLQGFPGSERLMEYEDKLNSFFPESMCIAICQYDRRCFSPEILLDIIRTHPVVVIGTEVCDNIYYLSPYGKIESGVNGATLNFWIKNILERKRAEQSARDNELRYRELVENINELIYTTSEDGVITYMNSAVFPLFGYNQSEVIGRPFTDFIYSEDLPRIAEMFRKVISGNLQPSEYRIMSKSGDIHWIRTFSRLILKGNDIVGIQGLAIDITPQKKAEELLRKSEEKYRTYMENAPGGLFIVDSNGRYVEVNKAACLMTGYSQKELLSMSIRELSSPESPPETLASFNILKETGRVKTDVILRKKDGNDLHFYLEAVAISEDRFMAFCSDITYRKLMETALEEERNLLAQRVEERTRDLSLANEELVKQSRFKDEFLTNMSHELRTPLTVILGITEVLQDSVYGNLNEKQHNRMKLIEENGRNLLKLINDILTIAKINAGKLEVDIQTVHVQTFCQTCLQIIMQEAIKKGIKVSLKLDDGIRIIKTDAQHLRQILTSLLSNAVKFTPEGGEIGLDVVGSVNQHIIHFIVWDTGVGISKEDMEILFKPFIQLDGSFSRQYAGIGLGLTLATKMTQLLGGTISVESEVGKGSRFIVSFPWQGNMDETEKSGSNTLIEEQTTEQALILIADDNEGIVSVISDYLLFVGYGVVVAWNGSEAIKLAGEMRPDVILMDIQMPGMDGLEAIRRIRTNENLVNTSVIIHTGLAESSHGKKYLGVGANSFICKPTNMDELVRIIKAQLGKSGEKEINL
jgi:PAS domain S-box-containing protein